jgi:3-deoxy-D-manno-octulosonic acid (KDO) 8-phosphate synthase
MQLVDNRNTSNRWRVQGVACGVDAVFMEVHDCPERALSDGPNALPLDRLAPLLLMLRDIHELVGNDFERESCCI